MDAFKVTAEELYRHIQKLQSDDWKLFRVNMVGDELWNLYLASFPEGTNPIYRKRTYHDCSICRGFVKQVGNIVAINKDGNTKSVWSVIVPYPYDMVFRELANKVLEKAHGNELSGPFCVTHNFRKVGCAQSKEYLEDKIVYHDHFYADINDKYIVNSVGERTGDILAKYQVFARGISEITDDAIDAVLDLIAANNLYRGREFKSIIEAFVSLKNSVNHKSQIWYYCDEFGATIRNTVIGTLLVDLSQGVDINEAVRRFEEKVAPANYKRPKPIVTKRMVDEALKTVKALGLEDSLYRRPAVISDISVNDILWVNRESQADLRDGVDRLFDELVDDVPIIDTKKIDRVREVPIEEFLRDIAPRAHRIEVIPEERHMSKFMAMTTCKHVGAKSLFKWDNHFAWSYVGGVADSIRERVRKAGGVVNAPLRVSLSWNNRDDLDIHMFYGGNAHLYYAAKEHDVAQLDVDANAGGIITTKPVENIFFKKMKNGKYIFKVHNYARREGGDFFEIEIFDNWHGSKILRYDHYPTQSKSVDIATITIANKKVAGIKIHGNPQIVVQSQWGIKPDSKYDVSLIMLSPNYWKNSTQTGNRHYFFILKDIKPEGKIRGFFNEFLRVDLHKHRKVFELLARKMESDASEDQLAGIGFSETQPDSILAKVTTGTSSQILKITI